ncbi:MAG TPA: CDP-glycerol glycerophosphotransferase family protein, partial [Kribbella sp.]
TFLLRGRTSGLEARYPVAFTFDERYTARNSGLRFYRYTLRVDFGRLLEDELLDDDFYDAWMLLTTEQHREPQEIRVGRTPFLARYLTNAGWAERGGRAAVVNPYYTFKAQRTSFQVSVLDADNYRFLRRELRTRHLQRLRHRGGDIWLVGERPYKAQDTGYHFFRHLRTRHPDVEAYYVVDRDSPERANVEPLGNVLDHGSKEHIRTTLLANKIAGSHHPDFLYPLRTKAFRRAVRGTRVFLQHGVMGTKWMANLYGKGAGTFEADMFVVSSEHEREYIVSDFGFDLDEVPVTGLSRFDALFAGDVDVQPGQVLVMPTWRDWLGSTAAFLDSEYFQRWSELLHDPRLRDIEQRHGVKVVFCLHPNMQHFRELFDDVPVRVMSQGEVDVQFLLKQSAALITDYSSVGFDFSFLGKPVLYFQFDRKAFLGEEGSHIDLDDELPGVITRTAGALLDVLEQSAARGFPMPAESARRADRFIDHRDRDNSERIYQAARATKRKRDLRGRTAAHPVVAAGWRYLRRSRYYFPAMRLMYRALLHLPADPDMVLFESGLGRQYADSPRYLYEELVRRGSPVTKVWAYERRLPTMDPHTKVVPRLSPQYFYYLARSRYWVNNQSFPHYVRRRPDGVFVQTWHGTPLKRMLWDLEEVHGRDPGYVRRATDGAAQWSVLVSPSPFATKAISSAFRFSGEVIETGYPRNDVLHADDRDAHAARIRRRLGLRPDQRVILYAPTFR